MKRIFFLFFIINLIIGFQSYSADNNIDETIKKIITSISPDNSIEANISLTAPGLEYPSKGVIKLQGYMTHIIMSDFIMWYDGTTMWAYSEATGEVNITSPSVDELITISPYAALNNYKPIFDIKEEKSAKKLLLIPKDTKSIPLKNIMLHIDNANNYITKIEVSNINGEKQTIVINNYKKRNKLPESAFRFNTTDVPQGTPVIDLR